MNTFVVGSNVDGKNSYLNIIKEYRVALVYYNPSGTIERDFNKIQPGDLIIIASGTNFNKKCFYAGYAQSSNRGYFDINNEKIDGHIYLDNFVCLTNYNIPFSTENSQKASTYTQPVYQLYESTPADKVIIEQIKNIIRLNGSKSTSEYNELLKNNYNLILTGAPGTGKTYLAKQIAAKMIFGEDISIDEIEKNENKKKKLESQYKFVQFHPSYDYTDFVEGIRPTTKDDDTYGFKRIDGTFKEFCKKAVNNIIDSKKTVNVISKEKIILEYLDEFSNEILETINENGVFELTETCKIYNYEQDDESINFKIVNNTNRVKIYNKEIIKMYEFYSNTFENNQKYKIKDFLNYSNRKCKHETYYHNFISAFYSQYSKEINSESINNIEGDTIKQENFVFVIDEINRGDINKILGELFYAIDLGYRGEKGKVETQYQNLVESGDVFADGFYIPENVYIIGTMNDIDRSVESMDFAIRRRFAWQEVKPEDTADEILKNVKINNAASVLNDFNKMIANKDALGEMYQIGASYFLKLNNYIDDDKVTDQESIKNAYQKLWDNHLKGLIHEYVRGKKSGEEIFDKIQNKYFDLTGINFKENNEDTAE